MSLAAAASSFLTSESSIQPDSAPHLLSYVTYPTLEIFSVAIKPSKQTLLILHGGPAERARQLKQVKSAMDIPLNY
jgi:hypothetical protein